MLISNASFFIDLSLLKEVIDVKTINAKPNRKTMMPTFFTFTKLIKIKSYKEKSEILQLILFVMFSLFEFIFNPL